MRKIFWPNKTLPPSTILLEKPPKPFELEGVVGNLSLKKAETACFDWGSHLVPIDQMNALLSTIARPEAISNDLINLLTYGRLGSFKD